MPRTGCFTRGKETRYLLYKRLGGPQGQSGRVLKMFLPPGFDLRTLQSVAMPTMVPFHTKKIKT